MPGTSEQICCFVIPVALLHYNGLCLQDGFVSVVELRYCFRQCGIVPDVISEDQLAVLLSLACGYGWCPDGFALSTLAFPFTASLWCLWLACRDAKTLNFAKFESLILAVSRFARTGDHSVRSLLQLLNSSEAFQQMMTSRGSIRCVIFHCP